MFEHEFQITLQTKGLTCYSVTQVGSIEEKTGGRKLCQTVLLTLVITDKVHMLYCTCTCIFRFSLHIVRGVGPCGVINKITDATGSYMILYNLAIFGTLMKIPLYEDS